MAATMSRNGSSDDLQPEIRSVENNGKKLGLILNPGTTRR